MKEKHSLCILSILFAACSIILYHFEGISIMMVISLFLTGFYWALAISKKDKHGQV